MVGVLFDILTAVLKNWIVTTVLSDLLGISLTVTSFVIPRVSLAVTVVELFMQSSPTAPHSVLFFPVFAYACGRLVRQSGWFIGQLEVFCRYTILQVFAGTYEWHQRPTLVYIADTG